MRALRDPLFLAVLFGACAFTLFWLYHHAREEAKALEIEVQRVCDAARNAAPLVRAPYRPDGLSPAADMPIFRAVQTIDEVCAERWARP